MQAHQRRSAKCSQYMVLPLTTESPPPPCPYNYSNYMCLQFSHLLVCLLPLARPSPFLNRCECGLGMWTALTFVLERLARARSTGGHGFSASTNSLSDDSCSEELYPKSVISCPLDGRPELSKLRARLLRHTILTPADQARALTSNSADHAVE